MNMDCIHCEDCISGYKLLECDNCDHSCRSSKCKNCNYICDSYELIDCNYCGFCQYCKNCNYCENSYYCISCDHCDYCNKCINSKYLYHSSNIKNYNGENYLIKIKSLNLSKEYLIELLELIENTDYNFTLFYPNKKDKINYTCQSFIKYLKNNNFHSKINKIYLFLINFYNTICKLTLDYDLNIILFPIEMINYHNNRIKKSARK